MSKMMPESARAFTERLDEFYLSQTVIQRCAHCPEWTFVGPAREGVVAHREHREALHPEIKVTTRRRRQHHLASFRQKGMTEADWNEIRTERRRRAHQNGVELAD